MALGEQLAQRRAILGLSLREVAKRAGHLSHTHIRDLEQERRMPSLDTLRMLSVALECTFIIINGIIEIGESNERRERAA